MLNKIRVVICSGMFVVAVSMSYFSYTQVEKVGTLEERNATLVAQLKQQKENVKLLETSCKIDQTVSFETLEKAEKMTEALPEILEKLESIEVKQNEVPANDQTQAEKASDARAAVRSDTELMELLDTAYCTAAGDSAYCAARQSVD